jgi:hypothetical protein
MFCTYSVDSLVSSAIDLYVRDLCRQSQRPLRPTSRVMVLLTVALHSQLERFRSEQEKRKNVVGGTLLVGLQTDIIHGGAGGDSGGSG